MQVILISVTSSERARAYQVRMILNSMKRAQSYPERGPMIFESLSTLSPVLPYVLLSYWLYVKSS